MTKLPVISYRERTRALGRVGFYFVRQTGSHIVLERQDPWVQVVVPAHRQLRKGTLRRIIRDAGLTVVEFMELL